MSLMPRLAGSPHPAPQALWDPPERPLWVGRLLRGSQPPTARQRLRKSAKWASALLGPPVLDTLGRGLVSTCRLAAGDRWPTKVRGPSPELGWRAGTTVGGAGRALVPHLKAQIQPSMAKRGGGSPAARHLLRTLVCASGWGPASPAFLSGPWLPGGSMDPSRETLPRVPPSLAGLGSGGLGAQGQRRGPGTSTGHAGLQGPPQDGARQGAGAGCCPGPVGQCLEAARLPAPLECPGARPPGSPALSPPAQEAFEA